MTDARAYILHENDAWTAPLVAALEARRVPHEAWFLDEGTLDLGAEPPDGVFYNRMSASSHTRGHRYGPELAASVVAWLESHGRRVVNGRQAIDLEVSKVRQYAALRAHGIPVPRTVAVVGRERLVAAARAFAGRPFITKHNRAGKGLGVRLFHDVEALRDHVHGPDFEPPIDGVTLLQEYIAAPEPFIVRCEFVGGRFLYAVRVDTSRGFELCPADACQVGDAFCPAGGAARAPFEILDGFDHPLLRRYTRFLAATGIEVAGIEMITGPDGVAYTYDVNTNTNYNAAAEAAAGRPGWGMGAIADLLCRELARQSGGKLPCVARIAG